jgi:NAD(P)H-quinone oxidoreductase subunit 5
VSGPDLVLLGVALPFALLALLGAAALLGRRPSERLVGRLTACALGAALVAFALAAPAVWAAPGHRLVVPLGTLFAVEHAAFRFELVADPLALWFALLTAALCGVVSAFAHRYLHRDPGYGRFFVLFAAFSGGLLLVALAGTVEVLFTGWELIGLASALLVGFFHERPAPVRNALHVFIVYRAGDAAMLAAAVLVHHHLGTGSLDALLAGADGRVSALSPAQATLVGGLLLLAVAAKSAQLPLSGWLPRAMEGPTPSSAVFYGALSVHAGAYLLLRLQPLLLHSPAAAWALGALGLASALHATLVGRAQTDIKSALSYASLTQVSLVLVEIAAGLRWLPVVHMTGHACLRLLQFLRAPSLLEDVRAAGDGLGAPPAAGRHRKRGAPPRIERWLYRHALERGDLEAWLVAWLVAPFGRALAACDRWERAWCAWLARGARRGGGDG